MRTLVLLAALLLVALQARAMTLPETADQVPAQDQPEAKDQDQAVAEDQDMAITFTGEERLARQASGRKKITFKKVCYCRKKCKTNIFLLRFERPSGVCNIFGRRNTLCCR